MTKAILIPGNGGRSPDDNWFPYTAHELSTFGIHVTNEQFPDPVLARAEYWLPFIEKLGADQDTIIIGHSSGAVAAIRYAETHIILGSVLVSASCTDLGLKSEKVSGYFDQPWNWDAIKHNQKWIIQFASSDDPLITIDEARAIHKNLDTEYYEYVDQDHFGRFMHPKREFPELVEALKRKLVV
jgi:serine hydrolase